MTNIVLTDDLKNIVLQQYHPRVRIQLWSLDQQEFEEQNPDSDEVALHGPVNIKILNDDLEFFLTHKSINQAEEYKKYVSKPDNEGVNQGTFKNILFTDSDDINTIIPFEYHKGVFYLRLPRWMRYIDMHILTSYYDGSDDIVLLSTDDIIESVNKDKQQWLSTNNSIIRSNDKIDIIKPGSLQSSDVGRYLVKLPSSFRGLPSIEIDGFYRYSDVVDDEASHQIGITDNNDRGYTADQIGLMRQDQKTLINNSRNLSYFKDQIITATPVKETIFEEDDAYSYSDAEDSEYGIQLNNAHEEDHLYEITVKYINDSLYMEEYNQKPDETVNRIRVLTTADEVDNYIKVEWTE